MANKQKISDEETIEILRTGMSTQFWALLCELSEENIAYLDEQIISKISLEYGDDGKQLTDLEVDRLRDKRSAMVELMLLPQRMIENLSKEGDNEEEDLDPYRPAPKEK